MSLLERQAGLALDGMATTVAEESVRRIYAARGLDWDSFGPAGQAKSVRDMGYHLDYLRDALLAKEPKLFENYVAWVAVLFDGLGFDSQTTAYTLQALQEVLEERLSPELIAPVRAMLGHGIALAQAGVATPEAYVHADSNLGDLAQTYLDALLLGHRQVALRQIMEAVQGGVPVRDVYLHVFQPVQHEIGRLWQINQITVAQEHYCTAATQLIMSQLYPIVFSTPRCDHRMVATCVGGELHEIGVRMVADFFEMAGWDTYYLGANMPVSSVLSAIETNRAEVLAISATMSRHVEGVAELIQGVRASRAGQEVRILTGGHPFNLSADLWHTVGADATARDAQAAIDTATELIS